VATATGGIPEIVIDGATGYLVAAAGGGGLDGGSGGDGFARDLAARVDDLVADPETARRFGRAGRQRVLDHFTWPAIAAQTAAIYERLLR